jgi:hypothetical protein
VFAADLDVETVIAENHGERSLVQTLVNGVSAPEANAASLIAANRLWPVEDRIVGTAMQFSDRRAMPETASASDQALCPSASLARGRL